MDVKINRLAPIPMDDRLMDLALELKEAGLPWEPEVGSFVWDHRGLISHPSPFAKGIYFILSMKRFLAIFGDIEQMKQGLVWLPTWYQARQVLRLLPAVVGEGDRHRQGRPSRTAEEEMLRLYKRILRGLHSITKTAADGCRAADGGAERKWIRSVIISGLGDIDPLPEAVRGRIEEIYGQVARAYLGWRRIQENQMEDWLPRETAFDGELLGELGHFYSDYQSSIKSLKRIRRMVPRLEAVDGCSDRDKYDQLIGLLLENDSARPTQEGILDRLTMSEKDHPGS